MKLYEVKGTGKLQGMTVMSLDAFVKGVKPKKEMDESDISGLIHAAKNYNKSFLITADCDDGKRRTYRVRAQSERVAREKFLVHHAMAKIVSVKEEGVAEGWQEDSQELEDWSKEVNKRLYRAHESQRPALARQLSKVEQKNFGSSLNQGGLTELVHSTLMALQKGQMVHYDPQSVGQMPFGSLVGDDARIIASAGVSSDELAGYRMLSDKGIVDNIQQFLKLRRAVYNKEWPQEYLDKFAGSPGALWLQFVEDLGWSKDDVSEAVQAKTDDKLLAYYAQRKAEAEKKKKEQGVAEGKARLPQPEDFDSDWDYQEALDAYERSLSGNDDYDYENMIDEADSENPDRITVASQGKGYIVYHSFNRDAYTARGVGEWKGQIEPEWFYTLADAEEHAEMEIAGHDEHYGKIDELTFKGSTCTKDCSGHEAGYNWYQRKGRVPNSHSKSFNKGADIAANESVNEAPGDFGLGANYRDVPDEEMQAFLDRTKNKEKTKRDKYDYPYVHASSIQIKNEEGREYDLDSLRKEIMTRPASILGQNAKMQHSETGTEAIFDIGLPALKGLAVNEKTGQFVVVDTCPGAGACKTYCYATKGSYVMFKAVSMGLARMLNFLLNDPEGFKNKLNAEIAAARSKMAKKGARVVVRWHDAGDFFSPEYLDMAYGVARDNPDVGFYAYTKIADVATGDRPKNFNMNFSQGALSGQEKKVDFKRVKHSKVVPKDMFFDLVARKGLNLIKDAKGRMQFASPENLEDFKTRIAKHYAIDKDSILTYDQMMDTPVGDAPKWNVIVMPGDGDNSANRNDVIGSYLLFH